ncbi:hypothetical protein [Clostridium kluyveri]|uniref:Transcriptional regulator n=2 Tax=Clostridium kluyveri TaxID=1534 RepID=A5MYT1_CLOK5|nr:hypothetical protein [Clostridium kluyveri]EDK34027.1 Hypothetical protein CKL_2015 [Clostridium kluyveri DSM 555]BAH06813.1 hypothetical protein CKR_1762 [Clostridium kluyveri NBRC 12016]
MQPNISALRNLVNQCFKGNKTSFALALGIDRGQVSKILKDGTGAGAQFFGKLMVYCENNELNFKDFIFLPNCVPTRTKNEEVAS